MSHLSLSLSLSLSLCARARARARAHVTVCVCVCLCVHTRSEPNGARVQKDTSKYKLFTETTYLPSKKSTNSNYQTRTFTETGFFSSTFIKEYWNPNLQQMLNGMFLQKQSLILYSLPFPGVVQNFLNMRNDEI